MYGANVLIFEGILAFHNREVLDLLDMKVFVDTDSDVRLSRRLSRDISQRGRDIKVREISMNCSDLWTRYKFFFLIKN